MKGRSIFYVQHVLCTSYVLLSCVPALPPNHLNASQQKWRSISRPQCGLCPLALFSLRKGSEAISQRVIHFSTKSYGLLFMVMEAAHDWKTGMNPRVGEEISAVDNSPQEAQAHNQYLRRLTGPEGAEFQVNTFTSGAQELSTVTDLSDGGYVVAWQSYGQDGSGYGIYAQRYTASGGAHGGEFQVNSHTTSTQSEPAAAGLTDGGFVVVWQSYGQDSSSYSLFAQRYTASSATYGSEFKVNTYSSGFQSYAAIAALPDGGFVVVWQSNGQDGSYNGVYAQRYTASSAAYGSEFRVNTYTSIDQSRPTIAGLSDGGFVIAWTSVSQDGSSDGVYAQRYTASSAAYGSEFRVNSYTSYSQSFPAITGLSGGGFVVTWQSYGQDGSQFGIYARRFTTYSTSYGSEFRVNTYTTMDQSYPTITGLADGGFVVAWFSNGQDGSNYGIFAQRYTASSVPYGAEFQVNAYTTGSQFYPAIASLSDGGFVVTWQSDGQDGSGEGIYGKRFDASSHQVTLAPTSAPTSYSSAAPTQTLPIFYGLVAHYPLNGNANDATGNGHDGSFVGAPNLTSGYNGNPNAAYDFLASSYITIPDHSAFDGSAGFSIAAWVKPESSCTCSVFSKWSGSTGWIYKFEIGDADYSHLRMEVFATQSHADFTVPVPIGKWSFVTTTYDLSKVKQYVNGVLKAEVSSDGYIETNLVNPSIGSSNGYWNLDGVMDEVWFYRVRLSDSQVMELFDSYGKTPSVDSQSESTSLNYIYLVVMIVVPVGILMLLVYCCCTRCGSGRKSVSSNKPEPDSGYELTAPHEVVTINKLIAAAEKGDTESVQQLINENADLDAQDEAGQTALMIAARDNYPDIVGLLVDAGANTKLKNHQNQDALTLAIEKGHESIIRILIKLAGSKRLETALMDSTLWGQLAAVTILLEAGVDVNAVNQKYETALLLAARDDQVNIAEALIEAKADVSMKDRHGNTALMLAATHGHLKVLNLLVDHQAALDEVDSSGNSALLLASSYGHVDIVSALTVAGADCNLLNKRGESANELATRHMGSQGSTKKQHKDIKQFKFKIEEILFEAQYKLVVEKMSKSIVFRVIEDENHQERQNELKQAVAQFLERSPIVSQSGVHISSNPEHVARQASLMHELVDELRDKKYLWNRSEFSSKDVQEELTSRALVWSQHQQAEAKENARLANMEAQIANLARTSATMQAQTSLPAGSSGKQSHNDAEDYLKEAGKGAAQEAGSNLANMAFGMMF